VKKATPLLRATMRRAGPKQTRKANKNATDHERQTFLLADAMEEPLSRAISYAGALELIGFGLCRIGDDHGQAVLAIAETISADLAVAQKIWRQIMATSSDAQKRANRRTKA
jgi:hypothetical protein